MTIGERRLTEEVLQEDYLDIFGIGKIKSLPELIESLRLLDEESFSHYVSKTHHRIGDWILEAYGNKALSEEILKIHSKEKMIRELERRLDKEIKSNKRKVIEKIPMKKNKKEVLQALSKLDQNLTI